MKLPIIACILTLFMFATARADPIIIGNGSATITNVIGVANFDALGLKVYFDLKNTSTDTNLKLVSVTSNLAQSGLENLNLSTNDSARFMLLFPHYWSNIPTLLDSCTITFVNATQTPEPASLILLGSGLLLLFRRKL